METNQKPKLKEGKRQHQKKHMPLKKVKTTRGSMKRKTVLRRDIVTKENMAKKKSRTKARPNENLRMRNPRKQGKMKSMLNNRRKKRTK